MRYNVIGTFFNQTLPSSIGGDAVRLWLVARNGAGWRAATYSIFVDRAVGLIALAVIIVASLPWSSHLICGSLRPLGADIDRFRSARRRCGLSRARCAAVAVSEELVGTHHIHACAVIANRVIFSRRNEPAIAVLSFLVHFLAVVIAWCVVQSIAAPVGFDQTFLLIPPVMLVTMLPISIAGWGVREATMALAFGYAGLATNEGVNVSLLYGAVTFVVGAIGGLVWILSAEKAARDTEPGCRGDGMSGGAGRADGAGDRLGWQLYFWRSCRCGCPPRDQIDPASPSQARTGKTECAIIASRSDAARRRHCRDRSDAGGRRCRVRCSSPTPVRLFPSRCSVRRCSSRRSALPTTSSRFRCCRGCCCRRLRSARSCCQARATSHRAVRPVLDRTRPSRAGRPLVRQSRQLHGRSRLDDGRPRSFRSRPHSRCSACSANCR